MNMIIVILLMLVSTIIGSFGSVFLKKGSKDFHIRLNVKGIVTIIKNWEVIFGLCLYALSTVAFIYLLKTEELSMLYPLTSLGYIFITILSVMILKEKINFYKIIGISFIILGVVFVTL